MDIVTELALLFVIMTIKSSSALKLMILVSEKCIHSVPFGKTIVMPSTGWENPPPKLSCNETVILF